MTDQPDTCSFCGARLASASDVAWREGWARGMVDAIRAIQAVGKVAPETLRAAFPKWEDALQWDDILIEEDDHLVRYGESEAKRNNRK